MRRIIPQKASSFFHGGKLSTNAAGWEFLQETNLEYDTSKSRLLPISREDRHIYKNFACKIFFSDHYIIHPFHYHMLQPWGNPVSEKWKNEYREKIRDQRLWLHFFTTPGVSAVVRGIAKRRLTRAFWAALEELEQKDPTVSRLKGTLLVELLNLKVAAAAPAFQFGKALAAAVMEERKRKKYD
jgi:hypothetical protein